jgi:tetratricopeptide (TPR) repeat protein
MSRAFSFAVALALLCSLLPGVRADDREAQFVGSSACATCHKTEHGDWLKSQHKAAMQEPTEATVLGRFDGSVFRQGEKETIFFRKDGRFFIGAEGPDGKPADFAVKYVFGVSPLQQYLIELPGGRLQAFGLAWDSRPAAQGGARWYDLYPDRKLGAGDPLHWTGIDQNWNYQCAWCHSTGLRKNYDASLGTFATRFSEISVGCEACHGPASKHLEWAAKPELPVLNRGFAFTLDRPANWVMTGKDTATRAGLPASDKEILVCAGCHSRRQQFSDDPVDAARFYDAFRPVTLEAGLYHIDGQQRDEVYNFGSFMQSRMHAAGVTCSDCHNPHSGKLRLAGNQLCAQCHAPAIFDHAAHHHHPPQSQGAQCANCHMPTTVYMGVDARRDHSMRIPRPDRSLSLGTPNACNNCHAGKSAQWAVDALTSWGAGSIEGAQSFAEAFQRADVAAPGAGAALAGIVADESQSAIARASALQRMSLAAPSSSALQSASRALSDKSPMVRAAAIAVVANADSAASRQALAPLLSDETRLVRMAAARALAGEAERALTPADRLAFEQALGEYVTGQQFNAERPESQANLGALNLARGKTEAAREAYAKALALDKTFAPAAIALADISRAGGDENAAEATLRKSIADNPGSGPLAHALGLSLVRQKRLAEAMESLEQAVALSPDDSRFAYVYAVALHDAGAAQKARETLEHALTRHPFDRDILMALASYAIESGDAAAARSHAKKLAELEPEDRSIQEFANTIEALSGGGGR